VPPAARVRRRSSLLQPGGPYRAPLGRLASLDLAPPHPVTALRRRRRNAAADACRRPAPCAPPPCFPTRALRSAPRAPRIPCAPQPPAPTGRYPAAWTPPPPPAGPERPRAAVPCLRTAAGRAERVPCRAAAGAGSAGLPGPRSGQAAPLASRERARPPPPPRCLAAPPATAWSAGSRGRGAGRLADGWAPAVSPPSFMFFNLFNYSIFS